MSTSALETAAMVGRTLGGKYRLVRLLGRGGAGHVFEAEHVGTREHLAIKMLDPEWAKDQVAASRFAREAQAASAIDSEHIVVVVGAGTDGGSPYIAMELLRGEDLGSRLRRTGRVPQREAVHVAAQVLRGLAAAHAAGIVHRDLKPDNVFLIARAGDASFAKIVDFGISKIERPRGATALLALTRKGVILGTPLYMAPEQARGFTDVDARADIFSVAAILFECLAGRPPHVGESYEQILLSICTRDAPDVRVFAPDVPEDVARLVARGLARDREGRFASAAEMLGALRRIVPSDPAVRPLGGESEAAEAETGEGKRTGEGEKTDEGRGRDEGRGTEEGRETEEEEKGTEEERALRARRARVRVTAMAIVAMVAGAGAMLGGLAVRRAAAARAGVSAGAGAGAGAGTGVSAGAGGAGAGTGAREGR